MKHIYFVFIIIILVCVSISCGDTKKRKPDYKSAIKTADVEDIGYTENNADFDKDNLKYKGLLPILQPDSYKSPHYYDELLEAELETIKKHYFLALELYNQKKYEESIDNLVLACQRYNCFGIIYYQLGLCLMDAGDYELAKMSFNRAANRGDTWLDELYSIDANDLKREIYFSYYNIACIESLQNNIDAAYEYLCKALYHGYPYFEHIKEDADLENLFSYNNGSFLKSIEEIYYAGSDNKVVGNGYEWKGGNASTNYYFVNYYHMVAQFMSVYPDPGGWITAEYETKNYIIIVKNVKYHYEEDERFKMDKFILYVNDFVSLDGHETGYEEVPLDKEDFYDLLH
jgi:tetratricopeptide (TPR) repeat protein